MLLGFSGSRFGALSRPKTLWQEGAGHSVVRSAAIQGEVWVRVYGVGLFDWRKAGLRVIEIHIRVAT